MPPDDAENTQLREQISGLRRFALWLIRDIHEADDLVQTTLERALDKWTTRRPEASLKSWLFTILYREFLLEKRRTKRYWELLSRMKNDDNPVWPSAEQEIATQSMLEAFGRLMPEQRSLLILITLEGLSYQEVAHVMDIPIGTVMSRLSRARQALHRLGEGETPQPILRLMK
ncbi:sigma-70 family RNA polymerase sigma factor [Aeromonas salmonicida subsp. achromogenes]|nr:MULTISPECIES: sigma-70 family RNA polymerase sigma factor [Gammaproteobacteria]HBD5595869.1 sigma-70 family RNA polymerase sigma factor [Escherichia coli]MBT1552292.1 sigma-70 family RNA polymerase sigma factor [Klebsiella pneumoniae]MBT1663637.1 sigma-70 family RNA polymerase sigma factor [Klebsiella pneumoniae]MCM2177344.1 sigma-70 family RNA polymerase sigma factor [Klebsiella pneumoniae]MCQ0505581.1 sigma-70 family RNA polymerase sigma factor [Klebsiella pneumoniae]